MFNHFLTALLGVVLSLGTPVFAEPAEEAIIEHLETRLPSFLDVADIAFKAFPSGNGVGRVSIEGQVTVVEPIYRSVSVDIVRRHFSESSDAEVNFARRQLPSIDVFERIEIAGENRFPFSAELTYEERVSSTAFEGKLTYPRLERDQRSDATLRSDEIVMTSAAFDAYVAAVGEKLDILNRYRSNAEADFARIGTAERARFVRQHDADLTFVMDIERATPAIWDYKEPMEIHATLHGVFNWKEDGRIFNTRYKAGDSHEARLILEYEPDYIEHRPIRHSAEGKVKATLLINDPDKRGWYRTGFGSEYHYAQPNTFVSSVGQGRGFVMSFEY